MQVLLKKHIHTVGWIASIMGMLMFLSYFDQIRLNIAGQKGSIVLPIVTLVNCLLWLLYSYVEKIKPVLYANIVGVSASFLTIMSWFY